MSQRQLQIAGVEPKETAKSFVDWALAGHGQLVSFAQAVSERVDVPTDVRIEAIELVKRWAATNGGGGR